MRHYQKIEEKQEKKELCKIQKDMLEMIQLLHQKPGGNPICKFFFFWMSDDQIENKNINNTLDILLLN